jgi:divalent metal cation (Fe/Co/Zn/Cd) transporter
LRHALLLEYCTLTWNLVEGSVALGAALSAGSIALFGFGVESFVEMASGGILIWRLRAEGRAEEAEVERLDWRAHRLVGLSLLALAAYVAAQAAMGLWRAERSEATWVGIAVTTSSLGVMRWLARAKRRAAIALGSRALETDSLQSTACWQLSLIALAGVGLNALLGWWWADPVAALAMTWFLVREGLEAWRGEEHCA